MGNTISKIVPFFTTFGVLALLILFVTGWLPIFIPQSNPYYHVARSIPRDPGAIKWDMGETGMWGTDGAYIAFSTGTPGDSLISFYADGMHKNGWVFVSEEYKTTKLFNYYIAVYERNFAGKNYSARIPLNIHKLGRGVSDNQISISEIRPPEAN